MGILACALGAEDPKAALNRTAAMQSQCHMHAAYASSRRHQKQEKRKNKINAQRAPVPQFGCTRNYVGYAGYA